MKLVCKSLELGSADRQLVLQALVLVVVARFSLRLMPFRRVPALMERIGGLLPGEMNPNCGPDRIAWAVTAVAHNIPASSTCLVQALAVQQLLKQRGLDAALLIGVAKEGRRELVAHAWVETNGLLVIGGPEAAIAEYTRLPRIQGIFS